MQVMAAHIWAQRKGYLSADTEDLWNQIVDDMDEGDYCDDAGHAGNDVVDDDEYLRAFEQLCDPLDGDGVAGGDDKAARDDDEDP